MSKILEIVKNLKLKPELPLSDFIKKEKRFYSTPCKTEDGKLVFIKILISKRKEDAFRLKKEVEATKFLSQFAKKNKNFNIPLYISANIKNQPYWFIHQYLPGHLLGSFYEIHKSGKNKEVIVNIVDNLTSLQKILSGVELEKRGFDFYLGRLKKGEKILKDRYPIDFKKAYNFFEKKREYFKKTKLVTAHGDYTLANFFVHKKKTYITDWEHFHLTNFAYDIAHLWIQTFRYHIWRKKLILNFISKMPKDKIKIFQELFRVVIITEALSEIIMGLNISPKHKLKARKTNIITIQAAIKSFDALMVLCIK